MKCKARLVLGDDYGDNSVTFRCQMMNGHSGAHVEEFNHVTMLWTKEAQCR